MTSTNTPTPHTEDAPDTPPEGRKTNITTRIEASVRARVEAAAGDCGMTMSDWVREVVLSALELHENPEDPGDLVVEQVGETEEEYRARVEAAAREARRALEAEARPKSTKYRFDNPRDCPHLPMRRSPSGRCGDCGGKIPMPGMTIRSSVGSMIGPR